MQQAQERFRATAAWWSGSGNQFRVTVLNYGQNMVQVSDVYVNGQRVTTWSSGRNTDIYVGAMTNLIFTSPTSVVSGATYTITIVSKNGVTNEYIFKV